MTFPTSGDIGEEKHVPDETYVPDAQYEEERIMDERARPPRVLDAQALRVPLTTLELPDPVSVTPGTSVREAVEVMQKGNFGCVLVTNGGAVKRGDVRTGGELLGIFTERDVLKKIAGKRFDWGKEPVSKFMTERPETVEEDANLAFCLNMMTMGGYRHVPIVDADGLAIGVVSIKDVVGYISGFFEKEVANLPPRPHLLKPTKREDG